MKHEVKVGDRFRLGAWEWVVKQAVAPSEMSGMFKSYRKDDPLSYMWLNETKDADQLDWIKPKIRFTREEAAKIERLVEEYVALPLLVGNSVISFKDFLDSHTEKD